jgi:hypothetical protein
MAAASREIVNGEEKKVSRKASVLTPHSCATSQRSDAALPADAADPALLCDLLQVGCRVGVDPHGDLEPASDPGRSVLILGQGEDQRHVVNQVLMRRGLRVVAHQLGLQPRDDLGHPGRPVRHQGDVAAGRCGAPQGGLRRVEADHHGAVTVGLEGDGIRFST